MLEIRDPGLMARTLELDLVRFAQARQLVRMPAALEELAQTLARIAEMLRVAERRGQAVDLGDEVVRVIERFRNALRAVGGEPAQA
jgi:type VI protein secretion system component VasF